MSVNAGWQVTKTEDGATGWQVHVTPRGDVKDHDLAPCCHCKPRMDTDMPLYVHMPLDGRELPEKAVENLKAGIESWNGRYAEETIEP